MPLEIDITAEGERRVVALRGELDLDTSHRFTRELERACAGGGREIVLDLAGLEFMDSLGLHAILRGRAYCEKRGFRYSMSPNLPERVQRVLTVAGLEGYIPIEGRETGPQPRRG